MTKKEVVYYYYPTGDAVMSECFREIIYTCGRINEGRDVMDELYFAIELQLRVVQIFLAVFYLQGQNGLNLLGQDNLIYRSIKREGDK